MDKDNEIKMLIEKFPGLSVSVVRPGDIAVRCPADKGHEAAAYLKKIGFTHLASIEYVDWIKQNQFELVYNLWSYRHHITVYLKIRIPRDEAKYITFMDLWPIAQTHEREAHEMMGIVFEGNPELTPFILEDWTDLPPMRKDFNPKKYVKEKYDTIPFVEEEK